MTKKIITVPCVDSKTKEIIKISFPQYPSSCSFIAFKGRNIEVSLNIEELKACATTAIANIPSQFNCESVEFNIEISDTEILHISSSGNHIRFTSLGEETFYWVSDEFEDQDETESVLGAIAGVIVSKAYYRDNV